MRSIVQATYGGPESFRLVEDAPVPQPGKGQVVVRVRAAAVDAAASLLSTGTPRLIRLAYGLRRPRFTNPGQEMAGTVVAVGSGVDQHQVGDEVFGQGRDAFAELAAVPAKRMAPRPDGVTPEQAATLGVSGVTAFQAVRAARVTAGQRVLVLGAGGGVGSFAVQLAVGAGAEVTAVAGPDKEDLVRRLGATRFIDHTARPLRDAGPHDVVVHTAGAPRLRDLAEVLTTGGIAVHVGTGVAAMTPSGGIGRNVRGALYGPLVRRRFVGLVSSPDVADMTALVGLVAQGRLVPAIERVVPLADAADVVRAVGTGHARGKTVVLPQE